MTHPLDALPAFCNSTHLPWDERAATRFRTYIEQLDRFRSSMNLIGPLTTGQIVDDLFIDSLIPAIAAPPTGPILDIGSGAGFPGIPLKILYPDLPLTLVEPRKKRVTFLQIAIRALGLERVEILESRYEDLDALHHHYVISKAFQPPVQWLQTASTLRAPQGRIACMTRRAMIEELDAVADTLHLQRVGLAMHPGERGLDEDRASLVYGERPDHAP